MNSVHVVSQIGTLNSGHGSTAKKFFIKVGKVGQMKDWAAAGLSRNCPSGLCWAG